jgi:glyoxylase-like metal-dependent hydrolase (beta-lactamase superfamily II)/rhodanese-related sulfurtransferase
MSIEPQAFFFQQLNPGECRTYLIAALGTGEAVLVDPLLDRLDEYRRLLAEQRFELRYVIDTHTHADHLSAGAVLAESSGALYAMHKKTSVRPVSERLSDGATLALGDLKLEFIETAGHTRDSLSIRLPGRLLTGDWLFIGGAGRTDLPGGDPAEHWESLNRVIPALPPETLIYPAHDYRNREVSSLLEERKTNPNLRALTREAYVAWLRSLEQPTPEWMTKMLQANAAGARDPGAVTKPDDAPACMACQPTLSPGASAVPHISVEELEARRRGSEPPFLLDVRQPDEYVGPLGHLPGAVLIPLPELARRLQELEPHRQRTIVTVCRSGARSLTAANILLQAGFREVINLTGGTQAWNQRGFPVERD